MDDYKLTTQKVFRELSKLPSQFTKKIPLENELNFYKTVLECRKKTDAQNPQGLLEMKKWLEHLVKEEIIEKDTYLYHLQNIKRLEL